ncbi:MAG: GTPase domain-containing protein [Thermodesulfobacteriota bacterium]
MKSWFEIMKELYDEAKERGLWEKIRALLRGRKRILLLGASGAGKTQFVESIADALTDRLSPIQRTVAVEKRKAIIHDYPFLMLDTPGQRMDEAKRKKAITEAIGTGVEGIINVVCWGYHEADEADRSKAIPSKGNLIAKPDYLKERRDIELELLSEWVPWVDAGVSNWILTLLTKADLWWPDNDNAIRRYYEDGEYATIIRPTAISHSVVPYCSVIEPFYGTRTGGRFGDHQRAALRHHLLETLVRMSGIER